MKSLLMAVFMAFFSLHHSQNICFNPFPCLTYYFLLDYTIFILFTCNTYNYGYLSCVSVMENLTSKTTKAFFLSGERRVPCTVPELKKKAKKGKEKSYIPLVLPVDSNLSFKMAHTKDQHRLANQQHFRPLRLLCVQCVYVCVHCVHPGLSTVSRVTACPAALQALHILSLLSSCSPLSVHLVLQI